jgi:DNA uptake protein ComE-like DNA-binding protein
MLDRPRPWWVLTSLIPFGWLTWIGMVYAGVRARMPLLVALSVVFLASTAAAFTVEDDSSGTVSVIAWVAGVGLSLACAPAWQRRMRAQERRAGIDRAEERLADRNNAFELVAEDPQLAREAGIGRPDIPGAVHGNVVDVNSAPLDVISRLPGIDDATAAEIIRLREELDGFSSLADMGTVLDLPADAVEDLRQRVVFLPR